MPIEFHADKTLDSLIRAFEDSFRIEKGSIWRTCREDFSEDYNNSGAGGFYFAYETQEQGVFVSKRSAQDVAGFLHAAECKLKAHGVTLQHSTFANTNRPGIMFVMPSEFWQKGLYRRSLLTLLLRCGIHYKISKDNFDEALEKIAYARETKGPIYHFLSGYTKINVMERPYDKQYGWHEAFKSKLPAERVNQYLSKEE